MQFVGTAAEFPRVVVVFPAVAGNLEQLLAEILAVYLPSSATSRPLGQMPEVPYAGLSEPPAVNPEEEEMIASVMRMLRAISAVAERNAVLPPPPPNAVYGVLSSAELMMRWECLDGRGAEAPGLLHGFTYLATVFFLDRDLALRKSEQVRALVAAAGFEPR
jgi:hypothetical protein